MNSSRWVGWSLVVLASCSPPVTTDGGLGGGAGQTGGGGGGAGDGGLTFTVSCRDAGVVTDAGVDPSAMLGPACDGAEVDALIQVCRVEPMNYFYDSRCRTGSTARQVELMNHGAYYSCPVLGADVMHCTAPRVNECRNPDGGYPLSDAAQTIVSQCSASLGRPLHQQACADRCDTAHAACFVGCRTCDPESCGLCSFECGRQFVDCLRACPPP